MKVDRNVLDELIGYLYEWLDNTYDYIKEVIEDMNSTNSVEEIMEVKRDILLKYIDRIPMSTFECYFCLASDNCENCKYAHFHGACSKYDEYEYEATENTVLRHILNANLSDYAKITLTLNVLRNVIEMCYYKGEKYD